jgi:hypothetical protein
MEDVFKWFYNHVCDSSGDGTAALVCENYKDVSKYFIKWFEETYNKEFHHTDPTVSDGSINYHDNNENFIFTNKPEILYRYDYQFIILDDCVSCKSRRKYNCEIIESIRLYLPLNLSNWTHK